MTFIKLGKMMELKFNSQVCTTVEQSKKLLELGLRPETADMIHTIIKGRLPVVLVLQGDDFAEYPDIPAWSLHRLLSICVNGDYMGLCNININSVIIEDLFEQLIKLIGWAIIDGAFNKEYLIGD
jgi:hypothetical protein